LSEELSPNSKFDSSIAIYIFFEALTMS